MNHTLGALLVCACLVAQPAAATTRYRAGDPDSRVRTTNTRIAEVLDFALQRSPSLQDLVATLDFLDRVVYLEEGQCPRREHRGCLHLAAGGGSAIVVRIDPRQPIRAVVAQLAHELYHAVEIAREPDSPARPRCARSTGASASAPASKRVKAAGRRGRRWRSRRSS